MSDKTLMTIMTHEEMDAFCKSCAVKDKVDCQRKSENCSVCEKFYDCLPFCIDDVKKGKRRKKKKEEEE